MHLIDAVDADFFVVHARHGAQNYDEAPDYNVYDECVKTGKEIIANGDIKTKEQVDLLKAKGVKGVMIGRAAVLNPAIFNILKGKPAAPIEKIKEEYFALNQKYDEPFRYRKNVTKWLGSEKF